MKKKKQDNFANHDYQKNNELKKFKWEKYKIDYDLKVLYKIITSNNNLQARIFKTMPLEYLETNASDFFFTLMKKKQCEEFVIYFENDYYINKIINLLSSECINLTTEQLEFLRKFFNSLKMALIVLFDKRLKPIINNLNDSTIDNSNSINKTISSTKNRILN